MQGEIVFSLPNNSSVKYPFTIANGHSKTSYSHEIPLTQEHIDARRPYVFVSVSCTVNCEAANIREYSRGDNENYGIIGGNNSYLL